MQKKLTQIINEIKNKNHIIIINKIDLPKKLIISQNIEQEAIKISATKNINIDQLKNKSPRKRLLYIFRRWCL